MILYFNNEGKLTTITPHGEPPRQCGKLEIYVLFEKEYNLNNKELWLRFKRPSKSFFEADRVMVKKSDLVEFNKIPRENIGELVDGKKYQAFYIDLTDTSANKEAGNLNIVFTLYSVVKKNGVDSLDSGVIFGRTTFYLEETLGLFPDKGIGMTYSEYQALLQHVNLLQNNVTSNRVGILKVGEYDKKTGEIELTYDDEIVESLDYDEESGRLEIKW